MFSGWIIGINQGVGHAGRLCHLRFRAGADQGARSRTAGHSGLPLQHPHPWSKPGTILNSPGSWPDSIWCCLTGCRCVWALNFRGAGLQDRVYGPYFMRHALQNTPRPWRHFFFGDSEECLVELQRVLIDLQPDIEIVGMLSPPFRPFTEADEARSPIPSIGAKPDFVWVALPGVRMEQWIIENQAAVPEGCIPCSGRCIYASQRPPLVRSAVDATDGVDLGLPVEQRAAPTGPALPAISFHVRIILVMGGPAWASREEARLDNLGPERIPEN